MKCQTNCNILVIVLCFISFPKDPHRREAWINFVNKPGWEPKPTSVLCSLHFDETCFDRTSPLKVRLLPTALPSIEVERLKYVSVFKKNFNFDIILHIILGEIV